MESLKNICLSNLHKLVSEKKMQVKQLGVLPEELLDEACKSVPTSMQIRLLNICVRWTRGVMTEKCHYKNGVLSGPFIKWDKQGRVLEEANYLDGKKHGKFVQYNPSENTIHLVENYAHDLLHGERIEYRAGKVAKRETYQKGKRHGEKVVFFDGGEVPRKSVAYHKGKKEGYSRVYNSKSDIVKENLWVRGIRVFDSR